MSLVKITDAEKNQKGVTLLPNVPPITASQLKQKFEEKSDELIIPKFNELSDQLMDADGAAELGAKFGAEDTSVQGAIDSLISLSNGKQDSATAVTHTETEAVGASNKGVYVDADGVATAMTYEVNASVPANAVFTDHVYTAGNNITIEDGVISATGGGGGGTSDYPDLTNKPKINSVELVGNKTLTELGVPTALSQLTEDSTHRVVTDTEKSAWNGKSTVSVSRSVTTGTKIATVTVNGTGTDLYAPSGGGGDVSDAYKSIKVNTITMTASGEDTFEIKAGSNVNLVPDANTKSVTINASGGGQSTGDMLMDDYDHDANVKAAGGIEAYVASNACTQDLLEKTVGWVGKNLLVNNAVTTTVGGVTFTVNSDKSITANGSGGDYGQELVLGTIPPITGTYILSTGVTQQQAQPFTLYIYGLAQGGIKTTVDLCSWGDKTITLSNSEGYIGYEFDVRVSSGATLTDATLYPMLRVATDADDTYAPYHDTVEEILEDKQDKLTAGTNISIETVAGQTVISASGGGTYDSLPEAQGGTDKSLVLTGDKYTWNRKQEALTFDNTPTSGSNNPVKSGGIYTALSGKQDSSTAVTHTASTAVGSATKGVYIASNGQVTAMTYEVNKTVPSDAVFTDHTYQSKTAASGGTAESLCTTGEKYTWNNKVDSVTVYNSYSSEYTGCQVIKVTDNGSATDYIVKGSGYIDQSTHTVDSQTGEYIFTFTSTAITTSGAFDIYADVYGVAPSSVSVSNGSMVVKFAASDGVSTVRVYIR